MLCGAGFFCPNFAKKEYRAVIIRSGNQNLQEVSFSMLM